ncbi:MAG TPA: hypothetical protein PK954_26560 [Anaerolineales bacterium]|nr:hypothetical protein [Anaerolineales bacterium]HRF50466.1 hypothetical protein [Anaerolineales bacterium]
MRRIFFDSLDDARAVSPFFIAEEGVGIWLGTDDEELLVGRRTLALARDALHVPSLTRAGQPISLAVRNAALERAERLGLRERHAAIGYWTLSDTRELQEEPVDIVFSREGVDPVELQHLAAWLLVAAEQDAVAFELSGRVVHVRRAA